MKKYALVVDVPSIDEAEAAYNPNRPISSLLLHQIRHLHAVEQHLPAKDRTGINPSQLHSELDASNYIQKVTAKLQARSSKTRPSNTGRTARTKASTRKTKAGAQRRLTKKSKTSLKKRK